MSDNINWNETAIYDFLRFEHKPERQAAYDDRNLTKLANAGLIQRNEEKHTWKLTQKGEKKLADIRQHFDSGKLSELPLTLRHYYFDWGEYDIHNLPVNALSQVALRDRSAEIRRKAVELLDKYDKLDKETSNALSYDKDWWGFVISRRKKPTSATSSRRRMSAWSKTSSATMTSIRSACPTGWKAPTAEFAPKLPSCPMKLRWTKCSNDSNRKTWPVCWPLNLGGRPLTSSQR